MPTIEEMLRELEVCKNCSGDGKPYGQLSISEPCHPCKGTGRLNSSLATAVRELIAAGNNLATRALADDTDFCELEDLARAYNKVKDRQ